MTKCGLNSALWSPRFYLPIPDSIFDGIEYDSWMADTDQGEMFLNYFADPDLLPYMGVDVAWIGAIYRASKDTIGILVSQEKWTRAQEIVNKQIPLVESGLDLNR